MRTSDSENSLRQAAIKMQVTVGKILECGGLDPKNWFDQLVEAQQTLASKTKGTPAEFNKYR